MNTRLIGALRATALAIALTASGTAAALADPPGYYFQESGQPTAPQLHAAPPAITGGADQSRCAG